VRTFLVILDWPWPQYSWSAPSAGVLCTIRVNLTTRYITDFYHLTSLWAGIAQSAETRMEPEAQLDLAMYGVEKPIADRQTYTGTKDKVAQHWINILLQKSREIKSAQPGRSTQSITEELRQWFELQPGDKINPLLLIQVTYYSDAILIFDVSKNCLLQPLIRLKTPMWNFSTLFSILLGMGWHFLHTSWSEESRNLLAIRLQSTDIDGLTVPPIRASYMMQYKNNIFGKHFKTLMQTMAFHVPGSLSAVFPARLSYRSGFSPWRSCAPVSKTAWVQNSFQILCSFSVCRVMTSWTCLTCRPCLVCSPNRHLNKWRFKPFLPFHYRSSDGIQGFFPSAQ
jgi:hypothetical protein